MNPYDSPTTQPNRPRPGGNAFTPPPNGSTTPPELSYHVVAGPQPDTHLPGTDLPSIGRRGSLPPPQAARRPRRWLGLVLALGVVVLLAVAIVVVREITSRPSGAASGAFEQNIPTALEVAANACGVNGVLSDGARTMTLSRVAAEEDPGPVSYGDYDCILTELGTPQSVRSHMGQTRALDGMQSNTWNGFEALWTYHPDNGINITITMIDSGS